MNMLIRGGSIAAGHAVARSYADILKDKLGQQGIEVINRSRFGKTSFDGIGTFYRDIDEFRPELLLIHFGVDDAVACVYRSEFQENLVQMVRLARERLRPLIFLSTSHTFDHPEDMKAVDIFYRSLRIAGQDLFCNLIPIHTYWAGYLDEHQLNNRNLVGDDDRYPNERGHEVMSEAIYLWLINSLHRIGNSDFRDRPLRRPGVRQENRPVRFRANRTSSNDYLDRGIRSPYRFNSKFCPNQSYRAKI